MQNLILGIALLAISGCGCSIVSKSSRCQVSNGGLIVAVLPIIAVDRLGESLSDGRKQRKQQQLVLAGDPEATILCMQACDDYADLDNSGKLVHLSAQHIIDWWDAKPTTDQLPALIDAHLLQGRFVTNQDPGEAAPHWRRAAELAADPRITSARALTQADGYQYIHPSDFNRSMVDLETRLLVLRYQGRDGQPAEHSILDTDCHPVSAWPPAWMNAKDSTDSLETACRDAYIDVFEALPPQGKPVMNPN